MHIFSFRVHFKRALGGGYSSKGTSTVVAGATERVIKQGGRFRDMNEDSLSIGVSFLFLGGDLLRVENDLRWI